jgi:HPr kinase/phosphorylase
MLSVVNERSSIPSGPPTTTRQLLDSADVAAITTVVAGHDGLDLPITLPRIQKSGLALAGHLHGIVPSRVQVLGETELSYLETLDPDLRLARARLMLSLDLSCTVVTRGVAVPPPLVQAANETGSPLVVSRERSSTTITVLHDALDRLLAPRVRMHGVLVEVHGLGILLTGASGIGKSECALFLVERGHRFVADDAVDLVRMGGTVSGSAPPALRHHLEIRGLGVLNVRDLFGATAVRESAPIDLVVELARFDTADDDDRLGLDDRTRDVLGVPIPSLRIPVREGRDMGVLLEVAARNQLLKKSGVHGARAFLAKLEPGGAKSRG